jgi:phosphoglycolate phosphatase-like HAD superfamily hydrolase
MVVFDFDGVLADTYKGFSDFLVDFLRISEESSHYYLQKSCSTSESKNSLNPL